MSIRNPKVGKLARELTARTGAGMTEAILQSLESRLGQLASEADARYLALKGIASSCTGEPDLDARPEEDILGGDDSHFFDTD